MHHCKRAARVLTRADFEPLKTVGKGQWGKVFLVRKCSGPVAGRAAADPGLLSSGESKVSAPVIVETESDYFARHVAGIIVLNCVLVCST